MSKKLIHLTVLVAVILALAVAGCGSSSSSGSSTTSGSTASTPIGSVHFAKTKFLLHAGLAFGAFHRYILKPARAGDFRHPFSHKLEIVKAGLAGAFVVHELKIALHDAQSDPTLSKLVSPITALENRVQALHAGHGQVSSGLLSQAGGAVSSIEHQAASSGATIHEQAPSYP